MSASTSVVIPAKNEQDNILPLLTEINRAVGDRAELEVIYINDGSTDSTAARLEQAKTEFPWLKVITLKSSVGQSTAVYLGVQYAKGDLIATLDADGQNDPADIPEMLRLAEQYLPAKDFCIAGFRHNRHDTLWKRLQSKFANKIRSFLLNDHTPDTGCGLKVFPRATFLRLPYFDHMHRFLPALIQRLGGDVVIHPVNHRQRMAGQSKYGMLNRAFVGLVDIFGVMWLQRRNRYIDAKHWEQNHG